MKSGVVTEEKKKIFKFKRNVYIVKKQGLELYRHTDISGSLNVFNWLDWCWCRSNIIY